MTRSVVSGPVWLTSEDTWEKFPHLARYGTGFLIGWTTSTTAGDFSTPAVWKMAEITSTGSFVEGPITLPSTQTFGYGTSWVTLPDGDVAWPTRVDGTTIGIVRVDR